jgi:hypothetical protein
MNTAKNTNTLDSMPKMDAYDLSCYCWDNYTKITGLPKKYRNYEMEFPQEILDLIEQHEVDFDLFCELWG